MAEADPRIARTADGRIAVRLAAREREILGALAAEDDADARRLAAGRGGAGTGDDAGPRDGAGTEAGALAAATAGPPSPEKVASTLRAAATLEAAVARPRVVGGTAPERVREALAEARRADGGCNA